MVHEKQVRQQWEQTEARNHAAPSNALEDLNQGAHTQLKHATGKQDGRTQQDGSTRWQHPITGPHLRHCHSRPHGYRRRRLPC